MATENILVQWIRLWPDHSALEVALREELEIAWLRGRASCAHWVEYEDGSEDPERMAADYAERVVGGLTRPERPQ